MMTTQNLRNCMIMSMFLCVERPAEIGIHTGRGPSVSEVYCMGRFGGYLYAYQVKFDLCEWGDYFDKMVSQMNRHYSTPSCTLCAKG